MSVPPAKCPRCGGARFRQAVNYGEVAERIPPSARLVDVPFSIQADRLWICENRDCALAFTSYTWRDVDGQEWTMAESGT